MLAVVNVLGMLMAAFAVAYAPAMLWSLGAGDGLLADFMLAAGINAGLGLLLAGATRRQRRELKPRDGFLLVTLTWVLISGSAALPLMIALPGLSFTDAYFEAMSGLTASGASVLTGLDALPPSLHLWRHLLHWYGGLGIIVLAVAVLPLLGVGGMQLYRAETPGPMKDEKLTPRITETAKALWLTYSAITAAGIIALKLSGMNWLDAICHAFSAMALGGFSTHDASIGWFDSALIEGVLIVLMIAASLNFSRHFIAFRRLTLKPYLSDAEGKAILLILSGSTAAIAGLLLLEGVYADGYSALRHAAFNVVSMATTTGFVSTDFELWPAFAPVSMLLLSSIVASTGSTGGGVKMFRTLLLSRQGLREMKLLVHPSAVIPIRIGGQVVPDRIVYSVLAFIFLYFWVFVMLTLAMLLTGLDLTSSFSAVFASINNAGPGLGVVGPSKNYQGLTDLQTWICTVAMLLGRLEIFSVLVLFTPTFWRK